MNDRTLFFVNHEVQEKDAWAKRFETILAECQGSFKEVVDKPMWKGNACPLTLSSVDGDHTFCIWQCEPGTTLSDFQAFIDDFTGSASKNTVLKIDSMLGADSLSFESYIHDTQKLSKDGHVHPYAGEGNLWFVRHNIQDKAKWDQFFSDKFSAIKGKSNAGQLSEAWHVPTGVKGVLTVVLADEQGALCLWDLPKDYSEADFQQMIDNFTGESSKNGPVWKVDLKTAFNSRLLHPDFWAQEAIAYAESM